LRRVRLERIESLYLVFLRVGVLALATLCLLGAAFFIVDAGWRLFVSTDVVPAETSVSPDAVTAALAARPAPGDEAEPEDEIPAYVRERHARFVRDILPGYHAIYREAAESYGKPEDETLDVEAFMVEMGYDLETYAAGESLSTKHLVENASFQAQALAAVTAAMADGVTISLLEQYRDAQREQQCTTRNVRRRVSRVCGYYYRYDCSYTETVPIRECQAVYPDGIVSPLTAFRRADQTFAELWFVQTAVHASEAEQVRGERELTRSAI